MLWELLSYSLKLSCVFDLFSVVAMLTNSSFLEKFLLFISRSLSVSIFSRLLDRQVHRFPV